MKRFTMIELMVLLAISLGLSGCIGFKAFPLAARTGDTISLALGGTLVHETVPGDQITLSDLDISIHQDIDQNGTIESNEKFPVKKRYLFRLYPDPTSQVANYTAFFTNTYVGQWSAVVDLVDPDTDEPLMLAGDQQAKVVVTTGKLKNNMYAGGEGLLDDIPISILTGTGQSHNFNDILPGLGMENLKPLPQLAISFSGSENVAAAALDIDYDETVLTDNAYVSIRRDVSNRDVILNQRIYSDSGNWKMRIVLMTNQGTLAPGALKCFIVWHPYYIASGETVDIDDTFTVTDARFYNETGAEVTGINVVKQLLYQ